MDPIFIFKQKEPLLFLNENLHNNHYITHIFTNSEKDDIHLNITLIPWNYGSVECCNLQNRHIHDDLIQYSDAIYYKNGIIDKLFYDSTLVNADIHFPGISNQEIFYYRGIIFKDPDHVFYFVNPIRFVGGMWENVFILKQSK